MKSDYRSYFRGLLLLVEGRYEEALKIMEEVACDIERAIGDCRSAGLGMFQQLNRDGIYRNGVMELLREQPELYSIDWLRKAAEMGYSQAGCLLGLCYLVGKGVKKDVPMAISLLKSAARNSDVKRRTLFDVVALLHISDSTPDYVLGCIFSTGEFVDVNYAEAVTHYKRVAKDGSFYALLGALDILEGADGCFPISIDEAESLCADILVDDVARMPWELKILSCESSIGEFVLRKIEGYSTVPRYKLQGEILSLPRWSQKTGIPQEVLKDRISRGLPDVEVLRPLGESARSDEAELNEEGKVGEFS